MEPLPTGIICPFCRREVSARLGLNPSVLLLAVHLQASAAGVDVECSECGAGFIYRTGGQPSAPHLLSKPVRGRRSSTGTHRRTG